MKKIILVIVLSLCITLNNCCFLAGIGMESARKERQAKDKAFHEKIGKVMERISN